MSVYCSEPDTGSYMTSNVVAQCSLFVFEARCSKHGVRSTAVRLVQTTVLFELQSYDLPVFWTNRTSNETALRTKLRFEIKEIRHVVFVRSAVCTKRKITEKETIKQKGIVTHANIRTKPKIRMGDEPTQTLICTETKDTKNNIKNKKNKKKTKTPKTQQQAPKHQSNP